MRRAESVVLALATAGKTRDATGHAQPAHGLAPARENLVRVGLVSHVPHDPVVGRVEHVVESDGQLDRT